MEDKKNPIIICRCEDITLDEVNSAIDKGYTDFEELKRYLRLGMGPCQGRTCIPIVRSILARKKGCSVNDIDIPHVRQPNTLLKMGTIVGSKEVCISKEEL